MSITFDRVPAADQGGPEITDTIGGRVSDAQPGEQLVLYARSEAWWLQPGLDRPFTTIQDSHWSSPTHLGFEYAALLVKPGYHPALKIDALPQPGGAIVAVATIPGDKSKHAVRHMVQFAGYEWVVRESPSERGGKNEYDRANAWTDPDDALHLRISGAPGKRKCAQVVLKRNLGYGTYRFVIRDVAKLDPAAVLALYTWDGPAAANQNPQEWDIEFSRWGDPSSKNAQYVLQPFYVAGHTIRFDAPAGPILSTLRWSPGRAAFQTSLANGSRVAEHVFQSGVPTAGNEKFRINFYDFQRGPKMMQEGAEVVIEQFKYVP